MYVATTKIKVRYVETDQMGIVHHSNYYPWYEVARTNFFEEVVASYSDIEAAGLMLPLITSHCEYKKPARYGDEVTIKTVVTEVSKVKLRVEYKVYIEEQLIATGYTTQAFVDSKFRVINISKKFPDIYNKLIGCLDKVDASI